MLGCHQNASRILFPTLIFSTFQDQLGKCYELQPVRLQVQEMGGGKKDNSHPETDMEVHLLGTVPTPYQIPTKRANTFLVGN